VASLEERIHELPPELRREVEDFVEFLLVRRARRRRQKPRFEWAGALRELQGEYTSVELQHRIADWRAGEQ
jgi:hypothetical protein